VVDYRLLQKERRKVVDSLKKPLFAAQKELNDLVREVRRIGTRKKAVPDADDLVRLAKMYREIEKPLLTSLEIIKKGYPI